MRNEVSGQSICGHIRFPSEWRSGLAWVGRVVGLFICTANILARIDQIQAAHIHQLRRESRSFEMRAVPARLKARRMPTTISALSGLSAI
jgi:hypothetical protein